MVAIDLKIGEFEAKYAGKMQLYLTALDEQTKLPDGYKHKKCESCRNEQVQGVKNGLRAVVGIAGAVASSAVVVVTKGKINPKK